MIAVYCLRDKSYGSPVGSAVYVCSSVDNLTSFERKGPRNLLFYLRMCYYEILNAQQRVEINATGIQLNNLKESAGTYHRV
jgi:hypothetical protein